MFTLAVIVFGIAVIVGLIALTSIRSTGGSGIAVTMVAFLIAAGVFVGTSVGSVDAKQTGVVTSFKKPTGETKDAGSYWKKPWEDVTEMDQALQTDPYQFDVQLSAGSTATLVIYPSWEIAPNAAPGLYQDFKSFDKVTESLFRQQLVSTANNLFSAYNPLTNVDAKTGELKKSKQQWADELKVAMQANPLIDGRLVIKSISIPTISPDQGTQDNLNKIVAEFAKGSVLDQQKANADKQAEITAKNASVDRAARCLEITAVNGGEPGICANFVTSGNSTGIILNKPAK